MLRGGGVYSLHVRGLAQNLPHLQEGGLLLLPQERPAIAGEGKCDRPRVGVREPAPPPRPPITTKILPLGDSITFGCGDSMSPACVSEGKGVSEGRP